MRTHFVSDIGLLCMLFALPATPQHTPAPGEAARSVTPAPTVKEVLGRLNRVKSNQAVLFLGVVAPGWEVDSVGIGDAGPIKDGVLLGSDEDDPKTGDCAVCYLGRAGEESIFVIVTDRVPLRIGAGIWSSGKGASRVAPTKGVELLQLERGRFYLFGRLTAVESGATWEAEPRLAGWLRQLFAGAAPSLLTSARNLQPSTPTQIELLQRPFRTATISGHHYLAPGGDR